MAIDNLQYFWAGVTSAWMMQLQQLHNYLNGVEINDNLKQRLLHRMPQGTILPDQSAKVPGLQGMKLKCPWHAGGYRLRFDLAKQQLLRFQLQNFIRTFLASIECIWKRSTFICPLIRVILFSSTQST